MLAYIHSYFFNGKLLYANCPGIREAKPVVCFTVEHTVPCSMNSTSLSFMIAPLNQEECPTSDTFAQLFFFSF